MKKKLTLYRILFLLFFKPKKMNYSIVLFVILLSTWLVIIEASSHNGDTHLPTICTNGLTKTKADYEADLASWKNCRWQRMDIVNLTNVGFDLNGDGGIDIDECGTARHEYFSLEESVWGETCKEVITKCDCDGDGIITAWDFENSSFHCVPNCFKANLIWWLLGSRIANGKAYTGKLAPNPKDMPAEVAHHYS
jgi:hypothetical protein